MKCPTCDGEKEVRALVKFVRGGCKPMTLACLDCKGTGEVPDERATWMDVGARMRNTRLYAHMTLTEAAKIIGVGVVDLSDAEHGRVDPAPFIQKYEAAWRPSGGGAGEGRDG